MIRITMENGKTIDLELDESAAPITVANFLKLVNEKFYEILNGRMIHKQITIFTSNCVIERLAFDERILNRIQKMALPVPFPEESVRSVLATAENKNFYNSLLRR